MIELFVNIVDKVKRLIGWCPNISASETRKIDLLDNVTVNAPLRGEGPPYDRLRWWNKYHNFVLLVSVFLTLLSIKWFISQEINEIDFVLAVLLTGILFRMLTWLPRFYSLDRISISEIPVKSSTKRAIAIYIIIILSVLTIVYFWTIYGWNRIPGYFFGFLLVSWCWYLQILYWEKKNRKTIVISGYFKPTVSAVNLGDNE